jgi:hypothetical protein
LKFKDNDVMVTDEDDGRRKFVALYGDFVFIFQKETIDDVKAKKIVYLRQELLIYKTTSHNIGLIS